MERLEIGTIATVAAFVSVFAIPSARAEGWCPRAAGVSTAAGAKLDPLDEPTRAAIEEALRDELRSEAEYRRAIENGARRPFMPIARAEQRHAEFLRALFRNRQRPVPESGPEEGAAVDSTSVAEACAAAVASEVRNVALYDRLLVSGTLPSDVKAVFEHNRRASLEHHKPAFERCAGTASPDSTSPGRGRGWGRNSQRPGGPGYGGPCGASCGREGCPAGGGGGSR